VQLRVLGLKNPWLPPRELVRAPHRAMRGARAARCRRGVAKTTLILNTGRAWFEVLWFRPRGHDRAAGVGPASKAVVAVEKSRFETEYWQNRRTPSHNLLISTELTLPTGVKTSVQSPSNPSLERTHVSALARAYAVRSTLRWAARETVHCASRESPVPIDGELRARRELFRAT
jgi:hypothetical protein